MIGLIFILLIILLLYLILTETVNIRLTIFDEPKVKLSFVFFSISFTVEKQKERHMSLKEKINSLRFVITAFNEILSRSLVTVNSFDYQGLVFSGSEFPKLHLAIIGPAFLTYVKSRAAHTEIAIPSTEKGIDIALDINLYSLFISFVKSTYYGLRRKLARN